MAMLTGSDHRWRHHRLYLYRGAKSANRVKDSETSPSTLVSVFDELHVGSGRYWPRNSRQTRRSKRFTLLSEMPTSRDISAYVNPSALRRNTANSSVESCSSFRIFDPIHLIPLSLLQSRSTLPSPHSSYEQDVRGVAAPLQWALSANIG